MEWELWAFINYETERREKEFPRSGQSRGTLLLESSRGTPRKKPELLSRWVRGQRRGQDHRSLHPRGEFPLDLGERNIGTR